MKTHFDTGGSIPELAFMAIGGAMLAGAILYSTMGPFAGVMGAALGGLYTDREAERRERRKRGGSASDGHGKRQQWR